MDNKKYGGVFITTDKDGSDFNEDGTPYVEYKPELDLKRSEGIISNNTIDYYECPRCDIDSLDTKRMIPCPRGGCEAQIVGKINRISTLTNK